MLKKSTIIAISALMASSNFSLAALPVSSDITNTANPNRIQQRITQLDDERNPAIDAKLGDYVTLGGGINVYGAVSDKLNPMSFVSPSNDTLNLRAVFLNFDADPMSWMSTRLSISDEPNNMITAPQGSSYFEIKRAYINFHGHKNPDLSFIVGKDYLPFGLYQRYAIVTSLTHSLSEINRVGGIFTANYQPFFVSAFAFNMPGTLNGYGVPPRNQIENGGAAIGAIKKSNQFGYDARLSFLSNFAAIKYIYEVITSTNKPVTAMSAHMGFNVHRLGFVLNDIYPLRDFSPRDITFDGTGARPTAYDAEVNYLILVHGKPLVPALKYEHSSQALFLSIAHYRYGFTLNYGVNKYLSLGLQLYRGRNYGTGDKGTYASSATSFTTINGNNAWNDSAIFDVFAHF